MYHSRWYLHDDITDIEDREQSRKVLTFKMQVRLKSTEPRCSEYFSVRSKRSSLARCIVPSVIAVHLMRFREYPQDPLQRPYKCTHIVQDVDDNQDRHPQVKLAEELALHHFARLRSTELCVGIVSLDVCNICSSGSLLGN